jgi:hypothetical protein
MFKSFRFSLFEWALAATAFYCGAVFSGVHENWTTFLGLRPNEVGDFLAGVFGPLAFLWLVFGYYQQGEELKHSVEALRLQAEELNESVQQQRLANEISRKTLEFSAKNKVDSMRPKIIVEFYKNSSTGDGKSKYKLNAKNIGPIATNVTIRAIIASKSKPILCLTAKDLRPTDPDGNCRTDWMEKIQEPVVVETMFSDADGRKYSEKITFEYDETSLNFAKQTSNHS